MNHGAPLCIVQDIVNYQARKRKRILSKAAAAEEQAIAIYQAEVFWRPEQIFKEILLEEIQHREHLPVSLFPLFSWLQRGSGWILGSIFCLLPRALCYQAHVWAEREAAKIYLDCYNALKSQDFSEKEEILASLQEAEAQERAHAQRFAEHRQNTSFLR